MRALYRLLTARLEPLWQFPGATCETSLYLRGRSVALALAAFAVWLLVDPTAYALTGVVLCGSLLLLSYAWARSMAVGVSCRRLLRFAAVQVGDQLEEVLSLENRSRLPVIFAEFIDRSLIPGYSIDGVRVGQAHATEQWSMQATCTQRGIFHIGRWETHFSDPFGLFEVRQIYDDPTEITVYPPLAHIPRFTFWQRRTVGDRLWLRHPIAADTANAVTVRPYVHGEALRRIHWRTSARQQALFVKSFEPEGASVIWLILDLHADVHIGQGDESSLERMIVLAASLAARLLDQRLAVGLVLDAQRARVVPPRAGKAYLWTILRALAGAQTGQIPLAQVLAHASKLVSIRESAVILTPSLDQAWIVALRRLAAGGVGGAEVILLDPQSFGGVDSIRGLAQRLAGQGVPTHIVRREDIRPIAGAYAPLRRWEFKTLATGRVVLRQSPREVER